MVLGAQGKCPRDVRESLETLCRQYWPPLYAYVRHRGHSAHDAQDLTQEFFARLLAKGWLTAAGQENGRFRSFLLMAMKRFLANEWDRSRRLKRGGGVVFISMDATEWTGGVAPGDVAAASVAPDALYEKRWAVTLLESVMRRLRAEHEEGGRLAEYEALKPCLTAERGGTDYQALAAVLKTEPASARSAVHRLRKRFRELFRSAVAGTVILPGDVEDELRAVIAALGAE